MFCDMYEQGKYAVRYTYNLSESCLSSSGLSAMYSNSDGSIDIYECFPNVVKNAAEVAYERAALFSPVPYMSTHIASPATALVKGAEVISNSFLESLGTSGLVLGGLAVIGIGAVTAGYIYREQIQPGLSSTYNAAASACIEAKDVAISAFSSKLALNILELNEISKSLEKYALGGVEKEKLEKVISTTRTILKDLQAGKEIDPKEMKKLAEEVKIKLNDISFEGKGVKEEDKKEVGYMKYALIYVTQVLRNIFSFIGQFISEESNPAAKALLNRSFFISTPTTAREENEINENKVKILDTMIFGI